ncbi:hypothetical protein MNBD_GAMMA07-799, partial [hydrothermal vent metagenome]
MLKTIFNKKSQMTLSAIILFGMAFSAMAAVQVAYSGKYRAYILNVESANVINISVDVWAGFPRSFRVTLPNIAIPINHPEAPACQQELVQKALDFTSKFLKDAKKIEVRDITLENTGESDTKINIYTNKGSLADKLKAAGLARPIS